MTLHNCMANPCPVCAGSTRSTNYDSSVSTFAWNGPVCPTCGTRYVGSHKCSHEDIVRRVNELLKLLNTEPPMRPPFSTDRTTNCPCRPENGGGGICGCVLGGLSVTC